ncbi:hypothetical protein LPJ55_000869 [Coemansia sp. RSA 990]|nr:hypothetical protein LPJ68_001930 [Coemansia sp. RSA 1086]KAJ1875197.1 hypothetical protein LPJ55_000869 [Coemansia sp. RSA 990]
MFMFNKTLKKIDYLRQKLNTRLDRYIKGSTQKLHKKQSRKGKEQSKKKHQENRVEVKELLKVIDEQLLPEKKQVKRVSWSNGYEASEISIDIKRNSTDSSATAISEQSWTSSNNNYEPALGPNLAIIS